MLTSWLPERANSLLMLALECTAKRSATATWKWPSSRFATSVQHRHSFTRVNAACSTPPTSRRFQSLAKKHRGVLSSPGGLGLQEVRPSLPVRPEAAAFTKTLPIVCPGCGALSQTLEPDAPGYFSPQKDRTVSEKKQNEERIFFDAMRRLDDAAEASQVSPQENGQQRASPPIDATALPGARSICNRCHNLIYQSKGQPITHPSMESIREMIEASPYQRNHIYHVVDAADFPMSLIPNLIASLDLPKLRTQNRRSKSTRYSKGRTADVSFIITRSDLLAPRKEQVDRLMPYLQDVLRDALGKTGKNLRLGNVRCVSAKRGWWTPSVKREIWERGGAGWVVGKVNVGKSALFEVVFPKGRSHSPEEATKLAAVPGISQGGVPQTAREDLDADVHRGEISEPEFGGSILDALESNLKKAAARSDEAPVLNDNKSDEQVDPLDVEDADVLLPPAQPEEQYPQMPIVSALPGTTASPIRVPYGKARGELIDLPGIQRTSMETHVRAEHQASLVMKNRIIPDQHTIKPGQSLLIGGMIRITPKTEDCVFLAYPFTPLEAHVTAHDRAVAIQTGMSNNGLRYSGSVETITTSTAKQRIKSAGTFQLEWNVTKARAGPLTAKDAGGMKAENLPFAIYSADILIESVGWVELVCQVRNRHTQSAITLPEVEVFTPKGKFIAIRRPMNAWMMAGPRLVPKHLKRSRPRMSISMQKRKEGGRNGGHNRDTLPN